MNIRTILYKVKAVLLLLLVAGAAACDDTIEQTDFPVKEGMVPLEVKLAEAYTPIVSRAVEGVDNNSLMNKTPKNLPDGSTLRLIVLKREPDNVYITEDDYETEFTYVVRTADGKPYLYRCEVDGKGNLKPETVSNTPYYLTAGQTFYCMAISPARPLTPHEGKYMLSMYNGDELLATNNHWKQTIYSKVEVPKEVTERATVTLNPLMHTMARIRVTVKNGQNITELDGVEPIVELDRIPSDPNTTWIEDNFNNSTPFTMPPYNYAVGDTITAQMGNNILYNRLYIHDYEKTVSRDNNRKTVELSAETTILPMDARPTPMIIRLMLNVNLTPMQFHFQTRKCFLPGHTYNYIATVNLTEDAIYVVSWQDASWSTELSPEQTE